jgi:hypothetical protein
MASVERTIKYYIVFTISVHLNFDLILGVVFGRKGLIRG